MNRAPFTPLVPGGEGLDLRPIAPTALRRRMAAIYGVAEECVLPVRDTSHGLELVLRAATLDGARTVASAKSAELALLAQLYRLDLTPDADVVIVSDATNIAARAIAARSSLFVVDETFVEFGDANSLAPLAAAHENIIVLRSLTYAYGLAGAPCGAAIAHPSRLARLGAVMEPHSLPTPLVRLAEAALDPSRIPQSVARIDDIKRERTRLAEALSTLMPAAPDLGPFITIDPPDEVVSAKLQQFGATFDVADSGKLRVLVSSRASNDRVLAALGLAIAAPPQRAAEIVRDTKETRIVAAVNLDTLTPVRINTGVGFFDHMLAQVAQHGGFSLSLSCSGDLEIDAHQSIEDCAIAFGQALAQALGERRGIARFGFLLPMDETEAQVSIDLGGRPYTVFEGAFDAPLLGEYPTQMTEHIFRSLGQSLGAAIHVSVKGENDHHKTEACFKAFGRALRQAIRIEGDAVPSTKGVI
jgi:imidazoleglycerol-phosphate dehydratase / histidinol-phosphatase